MLCGVSDLSEPYLILPLVLPQCAEYCVFFQDRWFWNPHVTTGNISAFSAKDLQAILFVQSGDMSYFCYL